MRHVRTGAVVRVVELPGVHLPVELHFFHEHLGHETRQDNRDEQNADGVENADQRSVLAVEKARQQTREQHVQEEPGGEKKSVSLS